MRNKRGTNKERQSINQFLSFFSYNNGIVTADLIHNDIMKQNIDIILLPAMFSLSYTHPDHSVYTMPFPILSMPHFHCRL